jgi:hypothetical protein
MEHTNLISSILSEHTHENTRTSNKHCDRPYAVRTTDFQPSPSPSCDQPKLRPDFPDKILSPGTDLPFLYFFEETLFF